MDAYSELPDEETGEDEKPWFEGLSDRHRRFVEEYCKDFNATRAVIRAGYSDNEQSAAVLGHRLLRKANIIAAKDLYLSTLSMSAAEAIQKLSEWGRGTLTPFIVGGEVNLHMPHAQENLHLLKEVVQTKTVSVSEHSSTETVTTKIKLHDPMVAVTKILEVHGKIVNKSDITSGGKPLPGVMMYLPDNGRADAE